MNASKNISTYKESFFNNVADLIEKARSHVGRVADTTMCLTYFGIGKMIVEEEQNGATRALYGKGLIQELSEYLTKHLGKGYSTTNLKYFRQFYFAYSDLTDHTGLPSFKLGWSHYRILMRIKRNEERMFYELEAASQQWTHEELRRQYASSLYERLRLTRNKDEVMQLAQGQTIEKPQDLIKDPLVLEFLGLEEHPRYRESDLENSVIDKLEHFLLELGKGFLFVARQKRFSFKEKHFFVDLTCTTVCCNASF